MVVDGLEELYLGLEWWVNCESVSCSVESVSFWPHGLQPTRLLWPWNSPHKNTRVGAIVFSRGSAWRRDWTWVPCIADRFFTISATTIAQWIVLTLKSKRIFDSTQKPWPFEAGGTARTQPCCMETSKRGYGTVVSVLVSDNILAKTCQHREKGDWGWEQ